MMENLEKGKGVVLETIPKAMEEEPNNIDYAVLNIMGLEDACKWKYFLPISHQQIQKLEEVLLRAQ